MEVYRPPSDPGSSPLPPAAACWAEVERLLAFRDFAAAPQLRSFLKYIVQESLAERGDQLKERNIAVNALMRSSDFDPRLDCVVRVMAGKLRRSLECYYQGREGAAAVVRIEVPRGTYRPSFSSIQSDRPKQVMGRDGAGHSGSLRAAGRRVQGAVVAVLPLLLLTPGKTEQNLAEALACEVCVQLRQYSSLEILDYLVTRHWQSDEPGVEDEESVGCDFFVGGTCRRQKAQFRFTLQLTKASDSHLLWAEQFDLPAAAKTFTAEDAIVRRICTAVGQSLVAAASDFSLPQDDCCPARADA
jgi:TolB-like protein